jgi:hypothetical protein
MNSGETSEWEILIALCVCVLTCMTMLSPITAGIAVLNGCTDRQVIGAACLGAGVGLLWALKAIANMEG